MTMLTETKDTLNEKELEGVETIRAYMKKNYPNIVIPDLLNTDFNLLRWWTGYEGKIAKIGKRFSKYLEDRVTAGYSGEDFIERYFASDRLARCKPYLSYSRMDDNFNLEHNVFIFYEGCLQRPHDHMSVMICSEYLWVITGYCEYILRRVLHLEQMTGRRAYGVSVFDLENVPAIEWSNPFASYSKQLMCRSELWQNNYPDLVTKIFLINASVATRAAMHMAKVFMNAKSREGIQVPSNVDELILNYGDKCVPEHYGGTLTDNTGYGDLKTCRTVTTGYLNEKINPLISGDIFALHNITFPSDIQSSKYHIDRASKISIPVRLSTSKSRLCYHFYVNGIVDFGIRRLSTITESEVNFDCEKRKFVQPHEDDVAIKPNWPLITAKCGEEAVIVCDTPGVYVLDFHNRARLFGVNLELIVFECQ